MVDTVTRTIQLPPGTVMLERREFDAKELELLEAEMRSGAIQDGYLQLDRADVTELLLIYRGVVHSAVRVVGGDPQVQPLGQFFTNLAHDAARQGRFCKTDTGLLLLLAVYSQARPSIRAPSHIIDLHKLFEELRERGQSCVMVLSRGAERSFIFCKAGVPNAIYFTNKAYAVGRTAYEQITYYCKQLAAAPATIAVYYDMKSARDENAHRSFADLFAGKTGPAPFFLQVLLKNEAISRRLIQGGRCSIGRDPSNDIVIDHLSVSRTHCVFEWKGGLEVTDAGSVNGTFVGGKRVGRQGLRPGDRVQIGEYEVLYGDESVESAARPTLETVFVGMGGPAEKGAPKGQLTVGGQVISLDRPVFTLGSAKDANLRLRGFRIKPIQATIVREPKGGFRLLPAPGGRAVEVAGARVTEAGIILQAGHEIRIGRHKLSFAVPS